MGHLKILSNGLRLDGKAYILDSLLASHIRSRLGKSLDIESSRNITLNARDEHGQLSAQIKLGNNGQVEKLALCFFFFWN